MITTFNEMLVTSMNQLDSKVVATFNQLMEDQNGFVISAELVLVLTIAVLAMVVGLHGVAKSVTQEMNDLSNAIGALDQSYYYKGLRKDRHASVVGSGFSDSEDDCDCSVIIQPYPNIKRDGSGYTSEAGGY
jgi:hypothetical protein